MRYAVSNIIIGLGLWITISCSEELKPEPFTYSKVFTGENSKTWRITLFEETLNGSVTDRFMPSCLTDDRFKFYANTEHLYETMSGTKLCLEDEKALTSSVWTFVSSKATLTMIISIFGDDPIPFIVREASDKDLKIELFFDEENTGSYRIHFELVDEE